MRQQRRRRKESRHQQYHRRLRYRLHTLRAQLRVQLGSLVAHPGASAGVHGALRADRPYLARVRRGPPGEAALARDPLHAARAGGAARRLSRVASAPRGGLRLRAAAADPAEPAPVLGRRVGGLWAQGAAVTAALAPGGARRAARAHGAARRARHPPQPAQSDQANRSPSTGGCMRALASSVLPRTLARDAEWRRRSWRRRRTRPRAPQRRPWQSTCSSTASRAVERSHRLAERVLAALPPEPRLTLDYEQLLGAHEATLERARVRAFLRLAPPPPPAAADAAADIRTVCQGDARQAVRGGEQLWRAVHRVRRGRRRRVRALSRRAVRLRRARGGCGTAGAAQRCSWSRGAAQARGRHRQEREDSNEGGGRVERLPRQSAHEPAVQLTHQVGVATARRARRVCSSVAR